MRVSTHVHCTVWSGTILMDVCYPTWITSLTELVISVVAAAAAGAVLVAFWIAVLLQFGCFNLAGSLTLYRRSFEHICSSMLLKTNLPGRQ